VKKAERPDEPRHQWIKHIFRATYEMSPGHNCSDEIDCIEGLKEQQPGRLPGKDKRALRPQANCD